MTKIEDRCGLKQSLLYILHIQQNLRQHLAIKVQHIPYIQNPNNPFLSRFEVFPNAQTFCCKPDRLYSTQYSDLFVTYTDGFNMHTGQPNPQSMNNEDISGKIVLDSL